MYIARCVYFRDTQGRVPVYENAWPSQKYSKGFEAKFGENWWSLDWLVPPGEEATTYVPLRRVVNDTEVPQGKRGKLLLEYAYDGATGIHKSRL